MHCTSVLLWFTRFFLFLDFFLYQRCPLLTLTLGEGSILSDLISSENNNPSAQPLLFCLVPGFCLRLFWTSENGFDFGLVLVTENPRMIIKDQSTSCVTHWVYHNTILKFIILKFCRLGLNVNDRWDRIFNTHINMRAHHSTILLRMLACRIIPTIQFVL